MNRHLLLVILVFPACTTQSNNTTHAQNPLTQIPSPTESSVSKSHKPIAAQPVQKKSLLAYHHTSRNGITLSLVSFDDRDYRLQVADQSNGPGTHWRDAHSAATAHGGIAAINGGFFTPEGKPLGLVICSGIRRGYVNQSSLGAGIFLHSDQQSAITRRETYLKQPSHWGNISNLLQTGPMLVENKAPISGLSKNNPRTRSFIAWDGQHHWAIGYAESCTLDALSLAIAGKAPAKFTIQTAVNLDGGRSSDLWVSSKVPSGNHTHRGFFNKPVRNFLIVVPQ